MPIDFEIKISKCFFDSTKSILNFFEAPKKTIRCSELRTVSFIGRSKYNSVHPRVDSNIVAREILHIMYIM